VQSFLTEQSLRNMLVSYSSLLDLGTLQAFQFSTVYTNHTDISKLVSAGCDGNAVNTVKPSSIVSKGNTENKDECGNMKVAGKLFICSMYTDQRK
jgi:hypothetical protein